MTLTRAPEDWQRCRAKVRKLRMNLARAGYRTHWAWTVEEGSQTGMRHVHLLQHGDYVPQGELQERWGAIVDIRRIAGRARAVDYALKEAAAVTGYALKGTQSGLERHLELNGGRGVHLSRGYLRGLTTPDVERLLWPSDPELEWILVPAGVQLPDHLHRVG